MVVGIAAVSRSQGTIIQTRWGIVTADFVTGELCDGVC